MVEELGALRLQGMTVVNQWRAWFAARVGGVCLLILLTLQQQQQGMMTSTALKALAQEVRWDAN